MIKAIELENFKGICDRQRLELAPLTLLFGANSAGKSTMLQGLLYAHELLIRQNADADRVALGGDFVDLGGFESFVFGHERGRRVSVRIEIALDRRRLRTYGAIEDNQLESLLAIDLDDEVESVWIELEVEHEESVSSSGHAAIRAFSVGLGGEPRALARLETSLSRAPSLALWMRHPVFHGDTVEARLVGQLFVSATSDPAVLVFGMTTGNSPIPDFDRSLPLALGTDTTLLTLQYVLDRLVLGIGYAVREELANMLYVGPIRSTPNRGFRPQRSPGSGRWADGSGAWDLFAHGARVDDVNKWLMALSVGYRVENRILTVGHGFEQSVRRACSGLIDYVDQYFPHLADAEPPDEMPNPELIPISRAQYFDLRDAIEELESAQRLRTFMVIDERTRLAVSLQDVGVGVSQVLPIVAAAAFPRTVLAARCMLFEQPELHVHPAVQVGLGDLFIEAIGTRQIIAETHSEHLVLRLLRRIRETAEGSDGNTQFSLRPEQLSVLYVENGLSGARVRRLRIHDSGEFLDIWPSGFFEERVKELF